MRVLVVSDEFGVLLEGDYSGANTALSLASKGCGRFDSSS